MGGGDIGKIRIILGASILLLASVQVNAVPINYDESVSGDLVNGLPFTGLTNVGIFDIGTNTVSGSINRPFSGGGDAFDSFIFEIDVGHILTSVTFNFNATGLANMAVQLAKIDDINAQTQFYNEHTSIDLSMGNITSVSAFSNVLPETAGLYRVNSPGNYGFTDDVFMAYTWVFEVASASVTIDIKPGSDTNSINLRSKGVIPVAILSTNVADGDALNFDAMQVDFSTVTFGPNGAVESHGQGHVEDVDGDGDADMVFHFKTQETGIACGDTDATLTGGITGGPQFTGTDTVKAVGCNVSKQDTSVKGVGAMSWIFLLGLSVLGLWRRDR